MAHVIVAKPDAVPSIAQVAAFLRANRWTERESGPRWAVYVGPERGMEIELPLVETAPDFPRVVSDLLVDLGRMLDRPPASILRDILAEGKDLLRLRVEAPSTEEGQLHLEAGRGVYQGIRDLFLAVASSSLDPRPVYPTRKRAEAMDLLRQARLGLPEHGSVTLVIENPLPPALGQGRLFNAPVIRDDLPFERRVSLRYAEAMAALPEVVRQAQLQDSVVPFEAAVAHGVSANLCEAVAQIFEATEARRVVATASLSARWPVPAGFVVADGVLGATMVPVLREAARSLREAALYADLVVEGPVVKLHSADAEAGGTAAIRAEVDGVMKTVWVDLGAADYARVIQAHKDGSLVRLTGELKREGRWLLRSPRDLQVIAIEEASP